MKKIYIQPLTEKFKIELHSFMQEGHSNQRPEAKGNFWFDDDDDMSVVKKTMKNADTGKGTAPGSGHSSFKPNLWDDDED